MKFISFVRDLLILFKLCDPLCFSGIEFFLHCLLVVGIFPKDVTLNQIQAEHGLTLLFFLLKVLAFKVLRPYNILKIVFIEWVLYLLKGSF